MEQTIPSSKNSDIRQTLSTSASKCAKYIGFDAPLKIQTTNAQELYNHYQFFDRDQIIVLDFRCQKAFEKCHIVGSINVPTEACTPSDFLNFSETKFSKAYWAAKDQKARFKLRKRWLVILIPFEQESSDPMTQAPLLFDELKLAQAKKGELTQDSLSLRNAILCNKMLLAERHRYSYIWKTSMELMASKYPFLCKFKDTVSGPIMDGMKYPSEIFEDCLYLGDAKTAKDERVLQSLGITHILNVTDNVPNYFEGDSNFKLEYSNIEIEDLEDAPINMSFEQAFNFIEHVLTDIDLVSKTTDDDTGKSVNQPVTKFELSCLSYRGELDTHTLNLDLSKGEIDLWNCDNKKRASIYCDFHVSEMHKLTPRNKLLVHCAMGRSRSASIVTMYIMKKFLIPYKIAVDIVRERRETIDINPGFVQQLKDFEDNGFKFPNDISDRCSESTEGEDNLLSASC